MSRPGY